MLINASIQIVPLGLADEQTAFLAIDKAIEIIKASGLRYEVGPMATVVQGTYDDIMKTFKAAQQAVLTDTDQLVVTIHLHINTSKDVIFEDKTGKHRH